MYQMNGGEACVKAMQKAGIGSLFQIPGESYLPVLKALSENDSISTVTCRHEGEAGYAALGYAEYTGKPGVIAVTRGPGAANATIALLTAKEMSLPLVMLMGQVPTNYIEDGLQANQYIDPQAVFGSLTKKVLRPRTPQEVADAMKEALETSVNGRPGPVVVELPIDVLNKFAEVNIPEITLARNPIEPDAGLIEEAAQAIANAERPLTITGETLHFEALNQRLQSKTKQSNINDESLVYSVFNRFVKFLVSGVMTIFRAQDQFDNTDHQYIGNLALIKHPPHVEKALGDSDVVIVAGHRLTQETTANYDKNLMNGKTIIQIYPDLNAIENIYSDDGSTSRAAKKVIRIQGDVSTTLERIQKKVAELKKEKNDGKWLEPYRMLQEEYSAIEEVCEVAGGIDLGKVVKTIESVAQENNAIIVQDAGNNSGWVNRYYQFKEPFSFFATRNGAMGYSVPAGLGIKEAMSNENSDRPVICTVGDGSHMMNGLQAMTTAAMQGHKKMVIIVCDNCNYGTIANHELNAKFEWRHGVELMNPDFAAIANALPSDAKCRGKTIEQTADFEQAMKEAIQYEGVSIINLKCDPRDIAVGVKPLKDTHTLRLN